MDEKDRKLLLELIKNSRTPINQLAKKIGVSREVATYRLNKLTNDKIIKEFYTVINPSQLGFARHACYFRFKGVTNQQESKLIQQILGNEFVTYAGPIIGKYNIVFDILAKNQNHLSEIVNSLTQKISQHIESYTIISTGVEQHFFPTKILGVNQETQFQTPKNTKLDKTDLKILSLISTNSRIEYKELSKKLNLTANAIKYRVKNLEKSKIIESYTIQIDTNKLGFELHNIQLKITNTKKESQLKEFLSQHKNIGYIYKYLGNENWDIDAGIFVKNNLELRDFILEIREKFYDTTKINDTYIVVEESKPNQIPKGVFENAT